MKRSVILTVEVRLNVALALFGVAAILSVLI